MCIHDVVVDGEVMKPIAAETRPHVSSPVQRCAEGEDLPAHRENDRTAPSRGDRTTKQKAHPPWPVFAAKFTAGAAMELDSQRYEVMLRNGKILST